MAGEEVRRTRVVLVAPVPPPVGGIGNWTVAIREFCARAVDVDLRIVDTAPRWRAVDDLSRAKRFFLGGVQGLRDLVRLVRVVAKGRPDLIHLTTTGSLALLRDGACLGLAAALRIPAVYHLRFGRLPEIAERCSWEWHAMRLVAGLATRIIALDGKTYEVLQTAGFGPRTVRLPNGVDLSKVPAVTEPHWSRPPKVLFVGWVLPSKGIGDLVSAWRNAHQGEWRLRIVGPVSPDYRQRLLAQAAELAVTMSFAGELPHHEVLNELASAQIFVLPSLTEGFPNVLLEAMACGCAIVATRVGAVDEILDFGTARSCGLIVEPENPEELSRAITRLMSEESLRESLIECARKKARSEYELEEVLRRLVTLWSSIRQRPTRQETS